jgi:hypothetical protein
MRWSTEEFALRPASNQRHLNAGKGLDGWRFAESSEAPTVNDG